MLRPHRRHRRHSGLYRQRAEEQRRGPGVRDATGNPAVLDGTTDDRGRTVFDLTLQTGSKRIVPAGEAETWGINGPMLGPTLRARRGEVVAPVVHNELPEVTTIHWHGMHLPAAMDGGPHQTIATGESWRPEWTVENPASTLWYHPHPHGETAEHVYRGVAGLFLIDDDEGDRLDLPREYGVDDVPLILQDRAFTDEGGLDLEPASFTESLSGAGAFGLLGDTILVNGTHDPFFTVTRTLIRFRILNGSNARFYNLGFVDERSFQLVATDNGFLPGGPVELTRLLVGPGERAEIVVEFTADDDVVLRSYEQDLHGPDTNGRLIGADDTFDLVRLRGAGSLDDSGAAPVRTVGTSSPPVMPEGATHRTFRLNGHSSINDKEMDMSRIDEVVRPGRWSCGMWRAVVSPTPFTFTARPSMCSRSMGRSRPPIYGDPRIRCSSRRTIPCGWRSSSVSIPTLTRRTCFIATCCGTRTTG